MTKRMRGWRRLFRWRRLTGRYQRTLKALRLGRAMDLELRKAAAEKAIADARRDAARAESAKRPSYEGTKLGSSKRVAALLPIKPGANGSAAPPPRKPVKAAKSVKRPTVADTVDAPKSDRNLLATWRAFSKRNLVTVGIFSLFVNLLMLTLPIYLFQLSDRVLTSRSFDTLVMLTLIAVGFIGVLSLLDILRRQLLNRIATRFETMFAGPVLAGIVATPQGSNNGSIGALRSLQQVRGFIASPIMLMMFDAPLSPIYFGAVFLIHPDLGVLCLGSGLLLIVIAFVNQRVTVTPLGTGGQFSAKADASAEALARNSQVINAMGMLNEGIRQWGQDQSQAMTHQLEAQGRNAWISGFSKFFRLLLQISILGWGGYLALTGKLTGGMMIAASIIAGRALAPIEGMIDGWRAVVQSRAAYKRTIQIVEAMQNEKPRLQLPQPEGRLSVEKLLYMVPAVKEPILNGVNFELTPGESLAIVGPSGSGKSSLARIIVGCQWPTAGKVRLDSTDLRNWDRRQFGTFTGYLPQEVELFPGTIKDNISRMRENPSDEAVYEAAMLTGVHDIICYLPAGYETVIDGNGFPLSGGQRQRIALARAFFGNPSLVVLDEPNANLDAAGEEALAETIRRAKARGTTVVAVTQRPALLQCVDKVLILRNGIVEAFGPPQDVLRRVLRPEPQAASQSTQLVPVTPQSGARG